MQMPFSLLTYNSLSLIAALLYLISAAYVLTNIVKGKRLTQQSPLALSSSSIGILLHGLLIIHSYSVNQMIANDFFSMLSLICLVISLLFYVSAFSQAISALAVIVFPLSALAILLNIGNIPPVATATEIDTPLQVHIILSILSYGLLTVAAFQAIFLSIQEKQLHNRKPSSLINYLPPLQLMELLLFRVLSLGLFLLTFALATGFIFLDDIFAQHLAHKTLLSILAWLVFATLIWGRHYLGWRGQQAVKWTHAGYISLMLAYFGSKFVLQLLLN